MIQFCEHVYTQEDAYNIISALDYLGMSYHIEKHLVERHYVGGSDTYMSGAWIIISAMPFPVLELGTYLNLREAIDHIKNLKRTYTIKSSIENTVYSWKVEIHNEQ